MTVQCCFLRRQTVPVHPGYISLSVLSVGVLPCWSRLSARAASCVPPYSLSSPPLFQSHFFFLVGPFNRTDPRRRCWITRRLSSFVSTVPTFPLPGFAVSLAFSFLSSVGRFSPSSLVPQLRLPIYISLYFPLVLFFPRAGGAARLPPWLTCAAQLQMKPPFLALTSDPLHSDPLFSRSFF